MPMMIPPGELVKWVPGQVLESSDGLGWRNVGLRAYRYKPLDVEVPALSHFMVVSYKCGGTRMDRRFEGRWTRTECLPGELSLLTRSQRSFWRWTHDVDVRHAYLSEALMSNVAADMLERPIADVRLHDLLKVRDPMITQIVDAIAQETSNAAIGGALCVEALGTQLAVHLLRKYASITFREASVPGALSPAQASRVVDFIDATLHENLTLEALAAQAGLGVWTFIRRFRQTFGKAPHAYIIDRRILRAQQLIAQGGMPVKQVACTCGFADQAHLTRAMQKRLGVTPGALRKAHAE